MSFYNFRAAENGLPAQLLLDGEITSDGWTWAGDVVARAFARELQSHGDVEVIINSPGGDVFAGAEIYSLLKAHRGRVTVKIAGIAASIASEIAMAGDEVLISPAGYMMIHQPWMIAAGDAREFEHAARQLDEISGGIVAAYREKTGMEEETIRRLMDEETYMNARSAIDMGFADGLWTEDRGAYAVPAAASMRGRDRTPGAILNRAREWAHEPEANAQTHADLQEERMRAAAMADAMRL